MSRLVLGGHSFCTALANESAPDDGERRALLTACAAAGINWFDTTYRPERLALGALLRSGAHPQPRVIAWNFFRNFADGEDAGGPEPYEPGHLDALCDDLGVATIDLLVVHPVGDADAQRRQERIAFGWLESGGVRALAMWHPTADDVRRAASTTPYTAMVRPCNIESADDAAFRAAKDARWTTFACSPFVRGWTLDALTRRACEREPAADAAALRARIADHLLRWSLAHPAVDLAIVAMRRARWATANAASAARGPLNEDEARWLDELRSA